MMTHGSIDASCLLESIKVKVADGASAKPSLMDRMKQAVGMKIENQ